MVTGRAQVFLEFRIFMSVMVFDKNFKIGSLTGGDRHWGQLLDWNDTNMLDI